MASETSIRIYIRGRFAKKRLNNIKALALKYFPKKSGEEGNISALFHDALNRIYSLNPKTSEPLDHEKMVKHPRPPPGHRQGKI